MSISLRFQLNPNLYLRDPQETELGRNIITHSILLIDEIGFENFTFKKLAQAFGSTEASIYRYFENKHLLLTYLLCWYWEWVSFRIDMATANMTNPEDKLKAIIRTIVTSTHENTTIDFVNENILHRIVITEGVKAYHSKDVDEENTKGLFLDFKHLAEKIAAVILEMNPDFPYPRTLATTICEISNSNIYYARHLPRLTDITLTNGDLSEVETMLEYFVFNLLDQNGQRS